MPWSLPAELVALARYQAGVVSVGQALTALTADRLARAVACGTLTRLWHGTYAVPELTVDRTRSLLAAADLTLGIEAVACHHTAAALHGFNLSRDDRIHVLAPGACTSRRSPLALHRDRILTPLVRVQGRLTVGPAETAVSVGAREPDGLRTLAVLDAALRSESTARNDLASVAELSGINNIRRVRRLVDWADHRAESPPESWLRWIVLDAGLPAPVPQFWVNAGDGQRFRLDLAWPEFKVACEYDGVEFHTGAQLFADRARLNALGRTGWTVLFATASTLFGGRDALLADLRRRLR